MANLTTHAFAAQRVIDPNVDTIGDPKSLLNFVPDTGAPKHMTPGLADLFDVEEGLDLSVEVADGHIIKCTKVGKLRISMIDDEGIPMEAILRNVMYVPGLSRRLFSITTFAEHGHKAIVVRNSIHFLFNAAHNTVSSVTVPFTAGCTLATHMKASVTVPTTYKVGESKTKARISLELLYKRLASRSQRSLLAAANHDVWQDATIRMENDPDLIGVQVSTIRAADCIKYPCTPSTHAGQLVGADVLHFPPESGITPDTKFAAGLICVDNYSSFSCIYGLPRLTTEQVISSLKQFAADNGHVDEFGFLTFEKLKSDSGSQFTSKEFRAYCCHNGVCLSLAAPKQQWQNNRAERTWQTIHNMARSMLVHARLPDDYWYHAVRYASAVFNVSPVQGLKNAKGECDTLFELFTGRKPLISQFRVFGCPVVAKKWTVLIDGKRRENSTQRGIRGVFIGFPANQKGYLLYIPSSWQIVVSGDVAFDETFYSAIPTTWKPFNDSLVLRPTASFIPDPNTTVEVTGDINSMFPPTEEGIYGQHRFSSEHKILEEGPVAIEDENKEEVEAEVNLIDLNDDQSCVNEDELVPISSEIEESRQVVDNSASLRTSGCTRKPPQRLTFDHRAAARDWSKQANFCSDAELLKACAADADDADLSDIDKSKFFPPPSNL